MSRAERKIKRALSKQITALVKDKKQRRMQHEKSAEDTNDPIDEFFSTDKEVSGDKRYQKERIGGGAGTDSSTGSSLNAGADLRVGDRYTRVVSPPAAPCSATSAGGPRGAGGAARP